MTPAEFREYCFWRRMGFLAALILAAMIGASVGLAALAIKAALSGVF